MSTARTEQIKLTATYMNGLAIAFFALGVLAPAFSIFYGAGNYVFTLNSGIGVLVCFFGSITLHLMARRSLRGLEP